MTATRKQHSTKDNPSASARSVKGVLYLAFELGWNEWKLAFATGPADSPRPQYAGSDAGRNKGSGVIVFPRFFQLSTDGPRAADSTPGPDVSTSTAATTPRRTARRGPRFDAMRSTRPRFPVDPPTLAKALVSRPGRSPTAGLAIQASLGPGCSNAIAAHFASAPRAAGCATPSAARAGYAHPWPPGTP
jgi:hypothetical protein